MNNPQRYISNLLHYGRNKDFDIDMILRRSTYVGVYVGYYFYAKVVTNSGAVFESRAATAALAIRRALENAGVTFR